MLLLLRYRYSTPPMPFVVVDSSPSQPRLFPFLSKKADCGRRFGHGMRALWVKPAALIAYLALSGALQAKIPQAFTPFKPLPSPRPPSQTITPYTITALELLSAPTAETA
jgi:hypothetical protein